MHILEQHGYLRAAIASPELRVADVDFNVQAMIECIERADDSGTRLVVFPELSITGYTCGDLFYQKKLLAAARDGLVRIAEATSYEPLAAVVGLPLEVGGRLFNCAALVCAGDIIGIVPKTCIPNTREFYEQRWFASSVLNEHSEVEIGSERIPFGTDLLFRFFSVPSCVLGIEICEDLWAVQPPSGELALAGATVIANPSASDETLAKADYRRELVKQQSARTHTAYLYAASGPGESSTDLVYSGHGLVAEYGQVMVEQSRFEFESTLSVVDIDCERLLSERTMNSTFRDTMPERSYRMLEFKIKESERPTLLPRDVLNRPLNPHPFVPQDQQLRAERCAEIFAIQSTALARRIRHTGCRSVVVGISGGLDSTLALLVMVQAFDRLDIHRRGIIAVTMPGFGTSDRTRGNAVKLAELLGVTLRTIEINAAVRQHFADIGHEEGTHDVVYENAQARERTQILMDVANQCGGFVVGTGDLSEAALGWCTFNADHMSMYHVNIGVPKTLVRYIIEWCADFPFRQEAQETLQDITQTPITPELLPLGEDGKLEQETEKSVGPYALHDFFLFHTVRLPFSPAKVLLLAEQSFGDAYTRQDILRWMEVFYERFFSQQYKRSVMPDGPKVGSVALSPRGDWRMPSDASAKLWLDEVRRLAKLEH